MGLFTGTLFGRDSNTRAAKKRPSQLRNRSLRLEPLEHRQLLTVVSITPVQDNSLIEYKAPTYSGGADPNLYVGLDHMMATRMRSAVQFDIAKAVPAGATINSVTLSVWVDLTASSTTISPAVDLHKALTAWGEGTSSPSTFMPPFGKTTTNDATWLNTFYPTGTWTTPGGDFSPTVSGTTTLGADGTSATFASTSQMVADVQSWLNNPSTNFGWIMVGNETQDSGKMIASRESTVAAHRPTLTIDYTVGGTTGTATVGITATDANKAEGNSGSTPFSFTVNRGGDTSGTASVDYAVTGSGANPADAADFAGNALPSGTVTFNAGEASKTVTINVAGDTTVEQNESFAVALSNPVGAAISTATATGTIQNDDGITGGGGGGGTGGGGGGAGGGGTGGGGGGTGTGSGHNGGEHEGHGHHNGSGQGRKDDDGDEQESDEHSGTGSNAGGETEGNEAGENRGTAGNAGGDGHGAGGNTGGESEGHGTTGNVGSGETEGSQSGHGNRSGGAGGTAAGGSEGGETGEGHGTTGNAGSGETEGTGTGSGSGGAGGTAVGGSEGSETGEGSGAVGNTGSGETEGSGAGSGSGTGGTATGGSEGSETGEGSGAAGGNAGSGETEGSQPGKGSAVRAIAPHNVTNGQHAELLDTVLAGNSHAAARRESAPGKRTRRRPNETASSTAVAHEGAAASSTKMNVDAVDHIFTALGSKRSRRARTTSRG